VSGRPVRRRVLKLVEQAGGWPVILARIASGEPVAEVARSFLVSPSFFSRLLHQDRDRHVLAVEARSAARRSVARGAGCQTDHPQLKGQ
jgi:hypothetical protein